MGIPVGGSGVLPSHTARGGPKYSEAGPVAPAGGGVGGTWDRARAAVLTTLRARSVTLQVPSLSGPPLSSQNQVQTAKSRDFS